MYKQDKITYYMFNETTLDPEESNRHHKILRENVVDTPSGRLTTLTFKQVLQSFGVKNWNGRIYTQDVVMKALSSNPLIQNDLNNHAWVGEFGHPDLTNAKNAMQRQMTLFPPNCCWTIDKYWVEGNLLMGECTTWSGLYGDVLRDRILTGHPSQSSSRAIGGVDSKGSVLPGYMIITYDSVERASHKEAMQVKGSEKVNSFSIPSGNSMNESTTSFNLAGGGNNEFVNYLLSENANKQQLSMLCDTLKLDYDSMVMTENSIKFTTINESTLTTVEIPIRQMVHAEYYNLF